VDNKVDEMLKRGLGRGDMPPSRLQLHTVGPAREETEDTVTLHFGAQMFAPPNLIMTARVTVQADRQALENGTPDPWRVANVELLRARAMPDRKPPPRQPQPEMGG
jgi:hypothetical protein